MSKHIEFHCHQTVPAASNSRIFGKADLLHVACRNFPSSYGTCRLCAGNVRSRSWTRPVALRTKPLS